MVRMYSDGVDIGWARGDDPFQTECGPAFLQMSRLPHADGVFKPNQFSPIMFIRGFTANTDERTQCIIDVFMHG